MQDAAGGGALMTTADVARWLRVAEPVVRALAKAHAMPAVRVGRNWRFSREAVTRWIERGGAAGGEDRD